MLVLGVALSLAAPILVAKPALAGEMVWVGGTDIFKHAANWAPGTIPDSGDVAVFSDSTQTTVNVGDTTTTIGGIRFDGDAPQYQINLQGDLNLNGSVVNGSGRPQTFNVGSQRLYFFNGATSGADVEYVLSGGIVQLRGGSSGGLSRFSGNGRIFIGETSSVTIGSLAGSVHVENLLGDATVTVGGLGESTVHTGVIQAASGATGTLALVKVGSGTLTLTGTNTYAGGTTISAGTLEIGNGGTDGSIVGNITNNAALVFNRSDAITYDGMISGTGSLEAKNGTTILTGINTYTGGTTISGGTLQIGNGGTDGSIVGDITNNAALVFNRSDAITYANTISGTGSLEVKSGTTILANNNSYSGGTTISGGTLQIGNGGTIGSFGSGAIVNNGTLAYNRHSMMSPVFDNEISGTGALDVVSGVFYTTANNSYSGTTTIRSGATFAIGDGTTTGSLGTGAVTNNGLLLSNRTDDYVISNDISGTGTFSKSHSGTAILTGSNTYTGLTTINSGALQIGNGGTTGSIASNISNSSSLIFNRSDGLTYSGNINGSGSVTVTNGVINLTGTNAYSGATHVNGGTLVVNGTNSASSLLTVAAGGTLGGSGTVGNTVIAGGTLSPGNSPGTLTVAGNLTLNPGSTFVAEIQGLIADRVNVTGAASLAGTLRLVPLGGGYKFDSAYTLLSATGGLTGTFMPVDTTGSFGAGVQARVSYTDNDVLLTLTPTLLARIDSPENASRVGAAIDLAVDRGADPSSLFRIYDLSATDIAAGVNSLSGEIHTAVPAMAHVASDQFLRTMLDANAGGRLGADLNNGSDEQLYSFWGTAYGSNGRIGGDAATGSADRSIGDVHAAAGLDASIMPGVIAGVAISGGKAHAGLPGVIGAINADVMQAGVYGTAETGPIKLGGALSFAHLDNQVSRSIPALGSSLTSSYATMAWSGRLEASATLLDWNDFSFSPLVAFQATQATSPGIIEAGGAGALELGRRSDLTSRTELGIEIDGDTMLGDIPITGQLRAAWAHYLEPDAQLTSSLVSLPGSPFTVRGAEMDRNSALLSFDIKAQLSDSVSLGFNLGGELSANSARLGGAAQLKASF